MQEGSRVALVHDFLLDMRGAERVFLALCDLFPHADVFTAVYDEEGTEGRFAHRAVHTSFLQRLRPDRPHLPRRCCRCTRTRSSRSTCAATTSWSRARARGRTASSPTRTRVHVCYCHNPFRYAWNAREETLRGAQPARARGAGGGVPPLAPVGLDRGPARRPLRRQLAHHASAASRATSAARRPCCTRRSRPSASRPATPGDDYVVLSELMPHKRIDGRRAGLHRAGPAAGGRRRRPRRPPPAAHRRARPCASPAGSATRGGAQLLARARALVVTATEEFGIAAVEAQAAGRPVIALRRGRRARDRARGRDRRLLRPAPSPRRWPRPCGLRRAGRRPAACVANARRFDAAQLRRTACAAVVELALDGPSSRRAARRRPRRRARGLAQRRV